MSHKLLILIAGAGLWSCSSHYHTAYTTERITVSTSSANDSVMEQLMLPYREKLAREMGTIIGEAQQEMLTGRPNSLMGQWASDVFLRYGKDSLLNGKAKGPVIVLFNNGGFRTAFPKGKITVGDVYKLMPFDNRLTAVKLPITQLKEIETTLLKTGGNPIAGFTVVKGKIVVDTNGVNEFWVITSDFLANGGDKMVFFKEATERKDSPHLLRDILMREIIRSSTLQLTLEERITF